MFSHAWLFMTLWFVAHQTPVSMEFSRQGYWSGLPFPPPGDLSSPGIEPTFLASPALAGRFFTSVPSGRPSVPIREMQFKITMRYHLTSARMAIIKKSRTINSGEDVERTEPSYFIGGDVKLVHPRWRRIWGFLKKWKMELLHDPAIHSWTYIWRKYDLKGYMHPSVHCSTVYNRQAMEAT